MSPHFPHIIVVNKEGKMPFILSWYVCNEDEVPAIQYCGLVP